MFASRGQFPCSRIADRCVSSNPPHRGQHQGVRPSAANGRNDPGKRTSHPPCDALLLRPHNNPHEQPRLRIGRGQRDGVAPGVGLARTDIRPDRRLCRRNAIVKPRLRGDRDRLGVASDASASLRRDVGDAPRNVQIADVASVKSDHSR